MSNWTTICSIEQLVENSGVAALVEGKQLALFYMPATEQQVFALSNYDPLGNAFVLSRGIVGDINGELVVASPLYKQHFRLSDGQCLEDESVQIPVWECKLEQGKLMVNLPAEIFKVSA